MPLTVKEWKFKIGNPLPDPVLSDDREQFPVEVVREVLTQLSAFAQVEERKRPADIVLQLATSQILFKDTPMSHVPGFNEWSFQTGQFEIWFRDRKKRPLAKYVYFGARTPDGKVIIGPRLKQEQVGQIQ